MNIEQAIKVLKDLKENIIDRDDCKCQNYTNYCINQIKAIDTIINHLEKKEPKTVEHPNNDGITPCENGDCEWIDIQDQNNPHWSECKNCGYVVPF